jgi:hypothetical protein
MIGQVSPASPAPPVFRSRPARAPIDRVQRSINLLGAPPSRPTTPLTPIGRLGTRLDVVA